MVEICWKYEATITQSHGIVIVPKIAQPYCLHTYVYHHNNYEHTHNDSVKYQKCNFSVSRYIVAKGFLI